MATPLPHHTNHDPHRHLDADTRVSSCPNSLPERGPHGGEQLLHGDSDGAQRHASAHRHHTLEDAMHPSRHAQKEHGSGGHRYARTTDGGHDDDVATWDGTRTGSAPRTTDPIRKRPTVADLTHVTRTESMESARRWTDNGTVATDQTTYRRPVVTKRKDQTKLGRGTKKKGRIENAHPSRGTLQTTFSN